MTEAKVEKVNDIKRKLEITVPKTDVQSFLKKAYQKIGKSAKISGFRKGKIPESVLDQHYGHQVDYECLNMMVDQTYRSVLQKEKLVPVVQPNFQVQPMKRNEDYQFVVEVEVKPEVSLKNYKDIPLKTKMPKVEKEEVEREIEGVRERFAESNPAKDGAELAEGFVATIDFEGKIDGKAFPGGTAKGYSLNFGKGMFLKSFEDQIQGMKKGEERDIKVGFPEDYFEKSLAGKTAEFHVTLQDLHEKKLPKVDDELAKDMGKKDLADLRQDIEKHILQVKKQQVKPEYIKELREKFLKDYKLEVPEGLVDIQIKEQEKALENNPKLKTFSRDEIRDLIRFEFILEAIAIAEKIQPTPQDVHQVLMQYAQAYKKPVQEIQQTFQNNGMLVQILSRLTLEKTIDFLIDHAKVS